MSDPNTSYDVPGHGRVRLETCTTFTCGTGGLFCKVLLLPVLRPRRWTGEISRLRAFVAERAPAMLTEPVGEKEILLP